MPFDQPRAFLAFGSVGTSLVNGGVDMTSAVKGPDDRRAVRCSGRVLEPPEETEPVTATVDHADIRGLVTTLLVSVAAPASL